MNESAFYAIIGISTFAVTLTVGMVVSCLMCRGKTR